MKNKLNGQSVKNLIIRNAHIVDPANKIDEVMDILVEDAKISRVSKNIGEVVDEIELNARKISAICGHRPKLYRSGTAYYDEVAVEISRDLAHEVVGYSLLGDAGATWNSTTVTAALLQARPGDIALLHMNHPEAGTGAGIIAAVPELKRRGFRFVKISDFPLK